LTIGLVIGLVVFAELFSDEGCIVEFIGCVIIPVVFVELAGAVIAVVERGFAVRAVAVVFVAVVLVGTEAVVRVLVVLAVETAVVIFGSGFTAVFVSSVTPFKKKIT